jgi:DNA-binding GntR family transcriptional regulator
MDRKENGSLRARLEEEIATGGLKPGERLDEASLAARFGVSRTPIREALQHLAAAGLVELRPHRSAVVSAPDPVRLIEMFDVMAEMEAMCGRLAAGRLKPESEAALEATLAACSEAAKAGDTDTYYFENENFHRAIYAASGNRFLAEQAMILHRRLAPFRRLQLRVRNRMRASQNEHEAIVDWIRNGDPDKAAELLRAHIAIQGARFGDFMASIEPLQTTRVPTLATP